MKIAILNLMTEKPPYEAQLLEALSNSGKTVEITWLYTETHIPQNTPIEYLKEKYTTFSAVKTRHFDGLIITGAPLELIDFEAVTYWNELVNIMRWADKNIRSTLYICWGAQAGLYYHYGIPKYELDKKIFGIFEHTLCEPNAPLVRDFDGTFFAPHSRYTCNRMEDIAKHPELQVLAASGQAGVYLLAGKDGRHVFTIGHSEYDTERLKFEYFRDLSKGLQTALPPNYFPDNDPTLPPYNLWEKHGKLLFSNWLNYYAAGEADTLKINKS